MTDIEDLLVRTLQDGRRDLPPSAITAGAVERSATRLQLRRRLTIGGIGVVLVAAIAGGTMLADGGSARDGRAPSYDMSASAPPPTS